MGSEDDPFVKKHRSLTERIVSIVESFGLVYFTPVSVLEKESMKNAWRIIDKSIGYTETPQERQALLNMISHESRWDREATEFFQSKYMKKGQTGGDEKSVR